MSFHSVSLSMDSSSSPLLSFTINIYFSCVKSTRPRLLVQVHLPSVQEHYSLMDACSRYHSSIISAMTGCPVGYKQPPRPNNYNLFATFATLGKFPSCTWIFDQLYKFFYELYNYLTMN